MKTVGLTFKTVEKEEKPVDNTKKSAKVPKTPEIEPDGDK